MREWERYGTYYKVGGGLRRGYYRNAFLHYLRGLVGNEGIFYVVIIFPDSLPDRQ